MRHSFAFPLTLIPFFLGCSDGSDPNAPLGMTGGSNALPAGTGGAVAATGGALGTETGGAAATGGTLNTGGGPATGGVESTGGLATGGGLASGGTVNTGGTLSTGGTTTTGGVSATGGVTNTGGTTDTGGAPNTGGAADTGGAPSTGGTTNTGGSTAACTDPQAEICSGYQVGDHCGLTYEIWTDSSEACMTNTATGFVASWDQGDMNYLARKGVRPGSADPIVTYSADYNPNGNSYLGVYGWTTDPLIEYYIIDSWGSWRPPGTDVIGTVQADGGTYEIYRSERVNKPSIEGNTTFWQYWSVRTEKRTSGTITVRPHFEAWAAFGLELGDFYEVSMLVEGYNSSGSADVTVSFQ